MAERWLPRIEVGYPVFLTDGGDAFGAVRAIDLPRGELIVNVENGGDFRLHLSAVRKVVGEEKKVLVDWDRLDEGLREAIRHGMDQEDYPPPGEEVELEPPPPSPEEDEDVLLPTHTESLRASSPPGELPGRDRGSRFGAPPSVTTVRRRT